MTYEVLSRRLRPQKFQELIGHDFMRLSLQAAILEQRLASAFIFSGLRGTGKTSLARILAKAINCTELSKKIEDFQKLPLESLSTAEKKAMLHAIEPCDLCQACLEIKKGTCPDVIEIDAASNRGIENIRSLKEEVFLSANYCFYKVYIIDEAHMLTQESFNALLKILEEPPAHVKFILASTELKKIPSTILSRCLNYEFAAIEASVLEKKLLEIVQLERPNFPPHWLPSIVKNSSGSVRDALSTLESLLHLDVEEGEERLASFLGFSNLPGIFDFLTSVLDQDPKSALAKLGELLSKGMSAKNFLKDLLEATKLILVATRLGPEDAYFQSNWQSFTDQIFQLKEKLSPTKAHMMFDLVLDFEIKASKTELEKSLLEVLTLRLASLEDMIGVKELIRALKDSTGGKAAFLPPPSLRSGQLSPTDASARFPKLGPSFDGLGAHPQAKVSAQLDASGLDGQNSYGQALEGQDGKSCDYGPDPGLEKKNLEPLTAAFNPEPTPVSNNPTNDKTIQPAEKALLGAERIKLARAKAEAGQVKKEGGKIGQPSVEPQASKLEEAPALYEEPEPVRQQKNEADQPPLKAGDPRYGQPKDSSASASLPPWALGQEEAEVATAARTLADSATENAPSHHKSADQDQSQPQGETSPNEKTPVKARHSELQPLDRVQETSGLKKQHQDLLEKDKAEWAAEELSAEERVAEEADQENNPESNSLKNTPYSSVFNSLTAHSSDEELLGEAPTDLDRAEDDPEQSFAAGNRLEDKADRLEKHQTNPEADRNNSGPYVPQQPEQQAKAKKAAAEKKRELSANKDQSRETDLSAPAFYASQPFPPFDHAHWLLFVEKYLDPPADPELFPSAYLAMLHCSKLVAVKNDLGVLAVPENFVAQGKMLIPVALLELVEKHWGKAYSFEFVLDQDKSLFSYLEQKEQASNDSRQKLFQTVADTPLIKQALDLFGGRLELVEKKPAKAPKK